MSAAGAFPRLDRHWWRWTLLLWLTAAVLLVWDRWGLIRSFALSDTDDNMRIMQVRALLAGQGWFDLRQYRLDPPFGANVHWSRLVDLPIAGIILALRPFAGGKIAEQAAVAIAPMLPLVVAMISGALIARRLVAPLAWPLAVALLLCASSARGMWAPLRIDHHGWQLAMLSLTALALTDPKRARGGLILGIATAISLTIGLELLILSATAGAICVLMWVRDRREAPRIAAYGASLAGGCALGYAAFASYANRAPLCDALTPVWLSVMMAAGALAVLLAMTPARTVRLRLILAAIGGAALAAGFALAWPDCLGRPERVSPELVKLWLSHVREARPIYRQSWPAITGTCCLPVTGLIGYAAMLWRNRRADAAVLLPWAALALLAAIAAALLLWQTRAGPAAQLLAVPGATGLVWLVGEYAARTKREWAVVAATVAAFMIVSGVAVQTPVNGFQPKPDKRRQMVNAANGRCPALSALRPIALLPKGYVLTFVDLGPRLVTVTHHDAVAGPYHRNGDAILAVQLFFRGDAANARRTIAQRHIDYVLICPNMSESTIYRSESKHGFYVTLATGKAPGWLAPVRLPADSPYRIWRVRR